MISWELKKLLKPTWIVIVLGLVASIWALMMYYASVSGEQRVIERFFSYWSVLGSLTFGGIILFVSTKLFSLDDEQRIKEVILSTKYGKRHLLAIRFFTIIIFTAIVFSLLTFIQVIGLMLFVENEYMAFKESYFLQLLVVFVGSQLFAVFSACLCTIFSSHTTTITFCAFLFGFTYIFRSNDGAEQLSIFLFSDLLDKGFFSYLMRADLVTNISLSSFSNWYSLLMNMTVMLMLTIQSRRHEL